MAVYVIVFQTQHAGQTEGARITQTTAIVDAVDRSAGINRLREITGVPIVINASRVLETGEVWILESSEVRHG